MQQSNPRTARPLSPLVAVSLFCLVGLILTVVMSLTVGAEGFGWLLARIE